MAFYWMHQDPVGKSKRVTDASGNVVSAIELDPWGGETNRSSNEAFQPRKFTTYERDSIGSDDAMHRRYNRWWARFEQPDPHDGSYDLGDPQSFNRFAYVQNDPVNFVDPTGLEPNVCSAEFSGPQCMGPGFWGGGFNMNDRISFLNPSGRNIVSGNFNSEVISTIRIDYEITYRALEYDDDEGNSHTYFWWEKREIARSEVTSHLMGKLDGWPPTMAAKGGWLRSKIRLANAKACADGAVSRKDRTARRSRTYVRSKGDSIKRLPEQPNCERCGERAR